MGRALILGLAGLLSAVVVDLDAWKQTPSEDGTKPKFSWSIAIRRWLAGFLTGFVAGLTTMKI